MSAPSVINLPPVNFGAPVFTSARKDYNSGRAGNFSFCLDDNSVGVIIWSGARQSLDAYIIDKSGAFTYYSTGPLAPGSAPYLYVNFPQYIIRLSPSFFYASILNAYTGQVFYTFKLQLYNAKLNNAIPVPIADQSTLTNPCNTQAPQYFYDAVQNILAVGFYAPIGQFGGPVNASFFEPSARGLNLVRSGFVGYYSDAPVYDPFNQTQSIGGIIPQAGTQRAQANGLQTQLATGIGGAYLIAAGSYAVTMGAQTDCATPSGAKVTSRALAQFYFVNNSYEEGTNAFDTTLPGVTGGPGYFNNVGCVQLFNGVAIYQSSINTGLGLFYALNRSGYYAVNTPDNSNITVQFTPGTPQLGANAYSKSALLLINAHRPVSIFGAYKT